MAELSPSSFLRLPEPRPFLQLKEVAEAFVHQLDHSHLALATSWDAQSHPKLIQLLQDLRVVGANICEKLYRAVFLCKDFNDPYLRFLVLLSTGLEEKSIFDQASYVSFSASSTAKGVEDAHPVMLRFCGEIMATTQEITSEISVVNQGTVGNKESTSEGMQGADDLAGLATECNELLAQIAKRYREVEKSLLDVELAKANAPSPEEIEAARQQWAAFSKDLDRALSDLRNLYSSLLKAPVTS